MEDDVFPFGRVRQGDLSEMHAWIDRGGRIDAPLLGAAAETWTPLMLACAEGDVRAVRAIIEIGGARASARVGTKVLPSFAPLHVASRYGHAGVAAALLELGAVVDAQDTIGMTPLHYAAVKGHLRTIDVLLSAGADASAEGPGGALALDAARMVGFDDACALLKKHSRREDAQIAERRKALGAWLESLGCGEFLWRLLRAGYDDLYFMAEHGLTEEDLDCVGVPKEKLGLRKKLLVMHGVEEFLDKLPGGKGTGAPGSGTENASTAKARSGKTDSNEEDSSFNGNSSVAETDRGKSSEESSDSSSDDSDSTTSS